MHSPRSKGPFRPPSISITLFSLTQRVSRLPLAQHSAHIPLAVLGLDEDDEVCVDVEVLALRNGRLAGLRGGRVRLLEELGLVQLLRPCLRCKPSVKALARVVSGLTV